MGIATTALRVTLGGVMAGHGLQKLAGKFGGPGLEATATGFERIGFSPGKPYAYAAALSETVGGGLLAAGALTPLGASMVTGTMAVAMAKVHYRNGLWVTAGGYEYNLLLMAGAFALTEVGPGRLEGPLEVRHLLAARHAPGGPELEVHGFLAIQTAKIDPLAIDRLKHEAGRRGADETAPCRLGHLLTGMVREGCSAQQ